MEKNIAVAGTNTRLGRILYTRPNFISTSMNKEFDILISCFSSDEITDWDEKYNYTVLNIAKLRRDYKSQPKVVLLASSGRTEHSKIIHVVLDEISKAYGWKIIKVPPFEDSEAEFLADQIEEMVGRYSLLPRVSTCKRKSFIAKLLGV